MKKIIIGIFSLALLFSGTSVLASTEWNGASNDCPSIAIANADTQQGWAQPCWPGTSINATDGQDVNVRIYYHNTGNSTSNNTKIYLNHNGGSSNYHSFSGQISGSQGSISFGPVYANLSSSQSLTFESVRWYTNNTSETLTTLPNGQDGSEILSGGLNIGSITSGWSSQGSLVINFKVGNNGNGNDNYDNCVISKFKIDGSIHAYIDEGDSADLDWDTNGCNSVYVSGPNYSSSSHDGSATIYPNYSGTYTITAYGNYGGTKTKSVYVTVDQNNNNNNSRCSISYFRTSPTSINYGGSSTLSWNMSNCTSAYISNIGNINTGYGSRIVYPTYTTNYILTAYGSNGSSDTDSVQVKVNNYIAPDPYIPPASCAVTTAATNINTNSATLNGFISGTANTYFEYGTSVNMGSQTVTRTITNSYINETISGLTPGKIYYFRLIANCQNGSAKGVVQVFQTLGGTQTTTRIVYQGTTVVGTASPIMLKIEDRYQTIRLNDIIDYTVTYKNISSKKLTHAMVQVILPEGISFVNASRGTFSNDTNTLSVPLDDLNGGDEGVIYLQGRVDSIENTYAQIVTTALLIYTNTNTSQENAMAYVLNNPTNVGGSSLGANAFFAGIFGMSLLGWLLLILIILIIILLTRRYYPKNHNNKHQ